LISFSIVDTADANGASSDGIIDTKGDSKGEVEVSNNSKENALDLELLLLLKLILLLLVDNDCADEATEEIDLVDIK
jgi:hypothetical protein